MFGETTIFYVKIWNHPTERTIKKWLFRVPGMKQSRNKAPVSNIYTVDGSEIRGSPVEVGSLAHY